MASFLDLVSGGFRKIAAATTGGVGSAGKIAQLDAGGQWPESMMPNGIGADIENAPASEALSGGDAVNIWWDTDTLRVRKADASDPAKPCNGFVPEAVTLAAQADVYYSGKVTGVSGLTPGAPVFLSASEAGGVTSTAPSASGQIVQRVGWAVSETAFLFEAHPKIEIA